MTIVRRPTPISAPVLSVADLDAWLAKRLEWLTADVTDPETIQHIGQLRHHQSAGAYQVLTELRGVIAAWLSEEREDEERASAEEAWERMRDAGREEWELRQAAGDR